MHVPMNGQLPDAHMRTWNAWHASPCTMAGRSRMRNHETLSRSGCLHILHAACSCAQPEACTCQHHAHAGLHLERMVNQEARYQQEHDTEGSQGPMAGQLGPDIAGEVILEQHLCNHAECIAARS